MNVRLPGEAEKGEAPFASTLRITGTLVLVPLVVTETKPPYEPAVKAPGVTDTVRTCGVVPEAGVTASQLPPENAAVVKFSSFPLSETMTRFWVAVDPPVCALNVNCVGEARIVWAAVLRAIPNNERVVREIAFRVFRFKGSSRSSELAQARSSRNSPPRGRRKPYDMTRFGSPMFPVIIIHVSE